MDRQTTHSDLWSSTRYSDVAANILGTSTSRVDSQDNSSRGHGFALRCVLSLPTTNTDNVAAKANQLANFPLNFLRTGFYFDDGKTYHRTINGYWWSATGTVDRARNLGAKVSDVFPYDGNYRGSGFALRCVIGRV